MKKTAMIAGLLAMAASVAHRAPVSAVVAAERSGEYVTTDIREFAPKVGASQASVVVKVSGPKGFRIKDAHMFPVSRSCRYGVPLESQNPYYFKFNEEKVYFEVYASLPTEYEGLYEDCLYISEDYDLAGVMEVVIDLNDCTNKVSFVNILPNGNEASTGLYNETFTEQFEPATIHTVSLLKSVARKGQVMMTFNTLQSGFSSIKLGNTIFQTGVSLRVNDWNEDYEMCFRLNCHNAANDELTHISQFINGADIRGDVEVKNNPEDYVRIDCDFATPPAGPYDSDPVYSRFFSDIVNGDYRADTGGCATDQLYSSYAMVCQKTGSNHFLMENLFHGRSFADNGLKNEKWRGYPLITPRFRMEGKKALFTPCHRDDYFSTYIMNFPVGGSSFFLDVPYNSHPRFNWEWDYSKGDLPEIGNSVPCLTLATFWIPNSQGSRVEPFYMGRKGELRICDEPLVWVTVKKNLKEVLSGQLQQFADWAIEEMDKRPSGLYEICLENDNVLVDGIQGLNKTEITINGAKMDFEPPTMTMLTFRNGADEMTDRFTVPEDGVLEFTAVDFFSGINEYQLPYFDAKEPAMVTVECSPMGEDSFSQIPVEEIPELYKMPEFGYFYRGSLSGVKDGSSNGWFDLRVTVEDASGNRQVQTLSPAFYIESAMTGVERTTVGKGIRVENDAVVGDGMIEVFDPAGVLVGSGEGRVSLAGLRGVYFVRCGSSSLKIIR